MNAPRYLSAEAVVDLAQTEASEAVADDLARGVGVDNDDQPAPAGFEIKTVDQAEWALMTIFSLENEVARREAALEKVKKNLVSSRAYFEPLLEHFYRSHPPKRGKTLHLANGDLAMRSQPAKLVVVDEEAVKKWAREHLPAALVASFVENLHKTVVNQHFDATGEIPPGCGVNDSFEKFSVNAPRGAKGA